MQEAVLRGRITKAVRVRVLWTTGAQRPPSRG